MDQLRPLLPKNDNVVIEKLTRKFFATPLEFQRNVRTMKLLNRYIDRIRVSPSKIYLILLELKRKLTRCEPFANEVCSQVFYGYSPIVREAVTSAPIANCPPLWKDANDLSGNSEGASKHRVKFITLSPTPSNPICHRQCSEEATPSESSTHGKRKRPRVDELTISGESTEASGTQKSTLVNSNGKMEPLTPRQRKWISPSPSTHRKLQMLQCRMEFLSREIRRMEEVEMDETELDDEESAYLRLDTLKREYLGVWRQFCRLRGISRHAGSLTRLPFRYSGSRFAVLNRAVEDHVNASHTFPDYVDVYKVVEETSNREQLGLRQVLVGKSCGSTSGIETLAREIFTDVGAILKNRRERQFRRDFGCHLTDEQVDILFPFVITGVSTDADPALFSAELRRRLRANRQIASTNLESLITKYARMQEDLERRESSAGQRQKEDSHTATVDLDAVEIVDITEESRTPPCETSSTFFRSEEAPMPVSFPDANIESPIFMDDLDVDGEEHYQQPQVGKKVPRGDSNIGKPPSTITISDDEEDEVIFRGYRPPPKQPSTMSALVSSGDHMTLSWSNTGGLVICRTQRQVLQVVPPAEMMQ
ncbi:unnamed protein product [Hydatigera taeniaeformis]|uniref:Daxx histone-binding domain-containing protein n=1 Tax=Hydatigena taeniaeformis TaxID=6205 RepID=A0A3P7FIR3_HYDTA|nr:unnamed protein product [Hydatigera taeniaeformis]